MKNNGDVIPFLKQKDYIMINNDLGGGSFGKTVLLQDPFIEELFVAKKYEPEYEEIKEKFYKNFLDEIKILYKLNHKNIVRIYNYYAYEEIFTGYILMEYVDGKNIEEFINDYDFIFETTSIDNVFIQLIDGFTYIEENGIIHRDIREGNILIDRNGSVKIIDFGIGKIFVKNENGQDSLVGEINRANSDTLPQEYYTGIYTTKTDMFYLAELLNRLLINNKEDFKFSYQNILDKMMEKQPDNRYSSFSEIKEAIEKYDFVNLNISKADKEIYQSFVNLIWRTLSSFIDERKFNHEPEILISQLELSLKNNCFEDIIQANPEVIRSIVTGPYRFSNSIEIPCSVVKEFLDWYKKSTKLSQKLILSNIISKLSTISIEEREPELPF